MLKFCDFEFLFNKSTELYIENTKQRLIMLSMSQSIVSMCELLHDDSMGFVGGECAIVIDWNFCCGE